MKLKIDVSKLKTLMQQNYTTEQTLKKLCKLTKVEYHNILSEILIKLKRIIKIAKVLNVNIFKLVK